MNLRRAAPMRPKRTSLPSSEHPRIGCLTLISTPFQTECASALPLWIGLLLNLLILFNPILFTVGGIARALGSGG